MPTTRFSLVGFIGLGAMGKHMAEQLAIKLPESARIFIFDVAKGPVEELVNKYPGKVVASTSPKEVTENSVPFALYLVNRNGHKSNMARRSL
jgi:3-hydroxyisobutyrate dehydrogenase-like beta-hydroxyacid dehydrogenase